MKTSKLSKNNSILLLFYYFFFSLFNFAPLSLKAAEDYGLDEAAEKAGITTSSSNATALLLTKIGTLVGVVLQFVGVVFFFLIIYGGLKWMFARGNSSDVDKAKDIILNSTIGLIIVMSAYAITKYIGGIVTK